MKSLGEPLRAAFEGAKRKIDHRGSAFLYRRHDIDAEIHVIPSMK
jgi:hypothetical protein